MIVAIAGIAFIVIVAIVVGIVDSMQAPAWRRIAAERRNNWYARQYETHGPSEAGSWDDD